MSSTVGVLPDGPRDLATLEMQYRMFRSLASDSVLPIHEEPGTAMARWAGIGMEAASPASSDDKPGVDLRAKSLFPLGPTLPPPEARIYSDSFHRSQPYLRVKAVLDVVGGIIL